MKQLFGYPVTLFLAVEEGTVLDVSNALKIARNGCEVEVDLDAVLDSISAFEEAQS